MEKVERRGGEKAKIRAFKRKTETEEIPLLSPASLSVFLSLSFYPSLSLPFSFLFRNFTPAPVRISVDCACVTGTNNSRSYLLILLP